MDRKEEYNKIAEKIVSHVENGTTDQAPEILKVPTSDYTSHERWSSEMKDIFQNLPLMLALSIEMPNPGDYKAMEVTGIPVLITRDKSNKVNAFRNVCTHRGAIVAQEGIGNRSRFSCPYHGWTYSNSGDLIGVTDKPKFGDIDNKCFGLEKLQCRDIDSWPKIKNAVEEEIKFAVQVNGKTRDIISVKKSLKKEQVNKIIYESSKAKKFIENKEIIKTIFVEDKIMNYIVK